MLANDCLVNGAPERSAMHVMEGGVRARRNVERGRGRGRGASGRRTGKRVADFGTKERGGIARGVIIFSTSPKDASLAAGIVHA